MFIGEERDVFRAFIPCKLSAIGGNELMAFTLFMGPMPLPIPLILPRFDCILWWSFDFMRPPFMVGWHGLPSRTSTGTATRLGDGRGCKSSPFSCRARFNLYLWFWNHIFTCTGDSLIMLAKCSRSGAERYRCCLNRRSSS